MAYEIPVFIEAVSGDTPITLSARNYRTVLDAIFATEGVVNATDLAVTQRAAGANMSVDVSPGLIVFQGESITGQGKYVARSSTAVNVNVSAAPGSGTRTDLIVAQLYDKQADGGTQYGWGVFALTGVTTAPASAVVLATLSVPAGTTSIQAANILQTGRQYAGLIRSSGLRPVKSVQAIAMTDVSGTVQTYSLNAVGVFAPLPAAVFAPLTVTVPPSGMLWVTMSANISNTVSSTATIWASWAASGSTVSFGVSSTGTDAGISAAGTRVYASKRTLVTGTPGASVTFTPTLNYSSTDAGSTSYTNGVLTVEFVA